MTTTYDRHRGPDTGSADLIAQLAELLACASWRLRRAVAEELAPLGLTFAQARALRLLARAGEPVRMGELAARLEVVPRSATSMVDALEAAGLVERAGRPHRPQVGAGRPRRRGRRASWRAWAAPAGRAPKRCSRGSRRRSRSSCSGCSPSLNEREPCADRRGSRS